MAGAFRVATGYVEITTRLDKDKIRAAAREAATATEAEIAAGGDRSGRSFADRWAAEAAATLRSKNDRIAKTIEDSIAASGTRSGTKLGTDVKTGLEKSVNDIAKVGAQIGAGLFSQIGASLSTNLTSLGSKVGGWAQGLAGKLLGGISTALKTIASFTIKWGAIVGESLQVAPLRGNLG